ncbi:L,D-transpeptidase family protein [Olivibacter sitiensis]|uniref:L,D-transpeptidase family protein n=1 Tax=Olivibacter sitiensis TaxID=376470 RepID=UPI000423810C|nr:L,D-transpeptidase family protein [Olivibacter sitiensis]
MKRKYVVNNTIYIVTLLFLVITCTNVEKRKSRKEKADSLKQSSLLEWDKTIPGSFSNQKTLKFDSLALDQFLSTYPLFSSYSSSMKQFYSKRQYTYAWYDQEGLIEQADNLADRMLHLRDEGLEKDIPYREALDSLLHNYGHLGDDTLTDLELMLTAQYFVFAHMAWEGMDADASKKNEWFVTRKKVSYEDYLDSLLQKPLDSDDMAIEPVYRQYEKLRHYLLQYRKLENREWPQLALDKKSIKPRDSSTLLPQLRERLFLLGDYKDTVRQSTYYDSIFVKAVHLFQQRHGLADDGSIGPGTLTELNISPKARLRQIMVNMERCRWLPVDLSTDYLAVNIPEFKLHVYRDGQLDWDCNVVVGQAVHKTVIFSNQVKYVVFSPYWNVPPSIVRNEVVPGMKKNSNYIARHNMEITGNSGGLPVVRQKPGPNNSLGLVKFLFPNSYNIYLHDTPAKSLFSQDSRAFSHGCIRVSEPEKLANFLLRRDSTWTPEAIRATMHAGKEKYVTLNPTLPVFIAYFTAFIDKNGRLNFRKDIYKRDERLANMLLDSEKQGN